MHVYMKSLVKKNRNKARGSIQVKFQSSIEIPICRFILIFYDIQSFIIIYSFSGISSLIFTKNAEALFFHSSSELQRLSLSTTFSTHARCFLKIPKGARDEAATEGNAEQEERQPVVENLDLEEAVVVNGNAETKNNSINDKVSDLYFERFDRSMFYVGPVFSSDVFVMICLVSVVNVDVLLNNIRSNFFVEFNCGQNIMRKSKNKKYIVLVLLKMRSSNTLIKFHKVICSS